MLTNKPHLSENPSPRTGHSFIPTNKNSFLMFGGASHEEGISSDLFSFDFDSLKFKNIISNGPSKRYDHAANYYKNALYVFGGASDSELLSDLWRLQNSKWTLLSSGNHDLNVPPRTLRSMPIVNNKIFIFGGGSIGTDCVDDALYIFDLETENWSKYMFPDGPCARQGHAFISFQSKIYLFGGMNGTKMMNDLWEFDTSNTR
jgi:tRNA wybutosine-synthesizing protein 3